jgi:hypothetical protein
MSRCVRALALAMVLACPLSASAHGWLRPTRVAAYYYPAPITWVPAVSAVYSAPYVLPVAPPALVCPPAVTGIVPPYAAPGTPYAVPVPAPPSAGPVAPVQPVEPVMPRVPEVSESHSYYDAYSVAPRTTDRPARDRYAIGFRNLSGRELMLKVDGRATLLEPGQTLSVQLPRRFVWQVVGRDPQSQALPDGESALEIVLRR